MSTVPSAEDHFRRLQLVLRGESPGHASEAVIIQAIAPFEDLVNELVSCKLAFATDIEGGCALESRVVDGKRRSGVWFPYKPYIYSQRQQSAALLQLAFVNSDRDFLNVEESKETGECFCTSFLDAKPEVYIIDLLRVGYESPLRLRKALRKLFESKDCLKIVFSYSSESIFLYRSFGVMLCKAIDLQAFSYSFMVSGTGPTKAKTEPGQRPGLQATVSDFMGVHTDKSLQATNWFGSRAENTGLSRRHLKYAADDAVRNMHLAQSMALWIKQGEEVVAEMADLTACALVLHGYALDNDASLPETAFVPDPFYATMSDPVHAQFVGVEQDLPGFSAVYPRPLCKELLHPTVGQFLLRCDLPDDDEENRQRNRRRCHEPQLLPAHTAKAARLDSLHENALPVAGPSGAASFSRARLEAPVICDFPMQLPRARVVEVPLALPIPVACDAAVALPIPVVCDAAVALPVSVVCDAPVELRAAPTAPDGRCTVDWQREFIRNRTPGTFPTTERELTDFVLAMHPEADEDYKARVAWHRKGGIPSPGQLLKSLPARAIPWTSILDLSIEDENSCPLFEHQTRAYIYGLDSEEAARGTIWECALRPVDPHNPDDQAQHDAVYDFVSRFARICRDHHFSPIQDLPDAFKKRLNGFSRVARKSIRRIFAHTEKMPPELLTVTNVRVPLARLIECELRVWMPRVDKTSIDNPPLFPDIACEPDDSRQPDMSASALLVFLYQLRYSAALLLVTHLAQGPSSGHRREVDEASRRLARGLLPHPRVAKLKKRLDAGALTLGPISKRPPPVRVPPACAMP
jgi:hypothetical protein